MNKDFMRESLIFRTYIQGSKGYSLLLFSHQLLCIQCWSLSICSVTCWGSFSFILYITATTNTKLLFYIKIQFHVNEFKRKGHQWIENSLNWWLSINIADIWWIKSMPLSEMFFKSERYAGYFVVKVVVIHTYIHT